MIYLEFESVKLGILPEVGGRIVSLQVGGSENLLKSNPDYWNEGAEKRLTPSPNNLEFREYNGHEVWLGPQSEWWRHQDLNMEKKDSLLFWPPDPYVSYGSYKIASQTETSIILEGEDSPISGVRFTKEISLIKGKDGIPMVNFIVTARNIRKSPVSWDLWMLTRVPGHNLNFVPVKDGSSISVTEPTHPHQGPATFKMENGYFSFTPLMKDKEHEECTAKAFITPSRPFIGTLSGKFLLVIGFEHHDPSTIHPEQREVEIYSFATDKAETSMLELEYHAPYVRLAPNQEMQATEHWQIIPFAQEPTEKEVVAVLNRIN